MGWDTGIALDISRFFEEVVGNGKRLVKKSIL
jgi:hypothetical protein